MTYQRDLIIDATGMINNYSKKDDFIIRFNPNELILPDVYELGYTIETDDTIPMNIILVVPIAKEELP